MSSIAQPTAAAAAAQAEIGANDEARQHDDQLARSYDATPYVSRAFWYTHPDALATVATLAGLDPAPPQRCRFLELGCASGGNLMPMAEALPDSTFVGIDLAVRQVEDGRRILAATGLRNVRLEALSILDVPDERTAQFGEFDYIVAHGVYSWVPPEVQEKILRLCAAHLAPHGVAYISYNTYPGWHQRAMVREMMLYHVEGMEQPEERAAQAQALVQFLHDHAPADEDGFRATLRDELKVLGNAGLHYLLHEHLDEYNRPLYFHEFVASAARHGLQYLGEARQVGVHLTADARQLLAQLGGDGIRREQYLDFIGNRRFRWTLVVRDGLRLHALPPERALARVRIAARLSTDATDEQLSSAEPVGFDAPQGGKLSAADAPTKRAMAELARAWPHTRTFDELLAVARAGPDDETFPRGLAQLLLRAYLSGLLELHVYEAPFVARASERPMVSPVQRLFASVGLPITNRRHESLRAGDLERHLIAQLDGTRDRAALLDALESDVRDGRISIESDDHKTSPDPAALRAYLESQLTRLLDDLSRSALYVA